MQKLTSLPEATEALLQYSPPDMKAKYQLNRMRALLDVLGNPQDNFRSIHIAGTSGKTSTAYFVRGLLEAAGCKTGLTVSPHIVAISERVQIGGMPLAEDEFLACLNNFLSIVDLSRLQPTYFELLIALAYWVFDKESVDYAVIETGLGGLLDGTNTITRGDKVCVITNIGLDHTEILGDTLPAIAAQKAGIIQSHNYVLVRAQAMDVIDVFERVCHEKDAELQLVSDALPPTTLPEFQHGNWALALATYEHMSARDGLGQLTQEHLVRVAQQTPPGRGEIYTIGDKTIILDGAHNPQKLEALLCALAAKNITSAAVLANFVESPDSKLEQSIEQLLPFADYWIVPEFSAGQDIKSRRSFASQRVIDRASSSKVVATIDASAALVALLARPEKVLLITGSLYLVSLLRPEILRLQRKQFTPDVLSR